MGMDYQFPRQLFPSFYKSGPPERVPTHPAGNWGTYEGVKPQGGSGSLSSTKFTAKHHVRGELWRYTEPAPVPLFNPKHPFLWSSTPPDPMHCLEQVQNFFMDHACDAFGGMSNLWGDSFLFGKRRKSDSKDSVNMWKIKKSLDSLELKACPMSYVPVTLSGYSSLLSDVVSDIPVELLTVLLHEELEQERDRLLFCEATTGGALAFVPFSQSGGSTSQRGCLLYPGSPGLDRLNFHRVELQHHRGGAASVRADSDPLSFQLKGPVRQISAASLFDSCCVAVRSNYMCGVWRFTESSDPSLLQVINTKEVATCISTSPHVLGEVLVASESGAAHLWSVGKEIQTVREEDTNIYFNANSAWRWCEFSAHPRVMVYADRTGAELTDIRASSSSSNTLFRISNTAECLSGERLILSRYLRDVHPFHHLVTTQYSAYLIDERFPCIPMLKWDHMMQSPPTFCHIAPGQKGGGASATKLLLGSQSSQEITLLQYSGGRAEACTSLGPPQALLRPLDSLRELPVQIPHRQEVATRRLSAPATGLTCIQTSTESGEGSMCVLQLTEAGDIFYQILQHRQEEAVRGESPPQLPSPSVLANSVWDTSSEEDAIGPTQLDFVPETPQKKSQRILSDSEESDSGRNRWKRRSGSLYLKVVHNLDPEQGPLSDSEAEPEPEPELEPGADTGARKETEGEAMERREPDGEETASAVKLSEGALATWRRWLQRLARATPKRTLPPQLIKIPRSKVLPEAPPPPPGSRTPEAELVSDVRRRLRDASWERRPSDSRAGPPPPPPFPELVKADAWPDQLSRRLTESWRGEAAWKAWWAEHLGHHRERKVANLRRLRRIQRAARREAGRGLELSGSFTSGVASQDLDSFSDAGGWSSAWSDAEGQQERGAASPWTDCSDGGTLAEAPATPRSDAGSQAERMTLIKSRLLDATRSPGAGADATPTPTATPASQRRSKRAVDDYLSSLFGSEVEPSQADGYFLRGSEVAHSAAAAAAAAPRSILKNNPSQDSSIFSQSLSQSSQGRPAPLQSSQTARKKRSRMGF